ncbi:MAG: hypothetical protein Q9188_002772 [Gyalolechia gomerana]
MDINSRHPLWQASSIINITIEWPNEDDCEMPQLETVMVSGPLTPVYNGRNVLRDLDLEGHLEIYDPADYARSDATVNKSILLVTKGKAPHTWRGPVVVLKEQEENMDFHEDITMTDFRIIS